MKSFSEKRRKLKVLIFSGAGASVQFDNLATKEFKDELLNNDESNSRVLRHLLNFKDFRDIEYVLECIKNLQSVRDSVGGKYLMQKNNSIYINSKISTHQIFSEISEIENYIMQRLFETYKINSNKHSSLKNFFNGMFDVILQFSDRIHFCTTNYDLAVEDFCTLEASTYTSISGFKVVSDELVWTPTVFDEINSSPNEIPVFLYKIHGSLDWLHDEGKIIKTKNIHYQPSSFNRHILIAPTISIKDPSVSEPFKTLFEKFEKQLHNADVCIVLGSSFRDKHVSELFVSFVNNGGHLIIVSPNCYSNYAEGLFGKEKKNSEEEWVEWSKLHSTELPGKVTFIDRHIDEKNNNFIFNEISKCLQNTHSLECVESLTKIEHNKKGTLVLEINKAYFSHMTQGGRAYFSGYVHDVIGLLKNIGSVDVNNIRIHYSVSDQPVSFSKLIENENVIMNSYVPIKGSYMSGLKICLPRKKTRSETNKSLFIAIWVIFDYENISDDEIIFTFKLDSGKFDQITTYNKSEIDSERNNIN